MTALRTPHGLFDPQINPCRGRMKKERKKSEYQMKIGNKKAKIKVDKDIH